MACPTAHAAGDDLVGVASVIDGDTIEIHGQRIRFHGIDAPESRQLCTRPSDEQWRCGQQAAMALSGRVGRATVRCEPRDRDRYGRVVAVCFNGAEDLNAWMVKEGWAVAYRQYSMDYVEAESAAHVAGAGIWSGTFTMPWDWRRGERSGDTAPGLPGGSQAASAGAGDCAIKGNISSKGERIYHVSGGRWYEQTRIDQSKGERWFCSEDEAQSAGWRRSRQ